MVQLRVFVTVAAAAALAAVVSPSVGTSSSNARAQDCGHVETYTGVEVVFGRFKTNAAADKLRDRVLRNGFANSKIIQACDFRVVVRGMESFDVAYELQAEARRVNYHATVECVKGQDSLGEIEAVFGHRRSRADAADLVTVAASEGFTGLQLEADPCGGFEVMFKGFKNRAQAEDYAAEANRAGFDVLLEDS